ncbi:MAG: hypothetical protein LBT79_07870, partial [Elusimicrobiota bacterium]|nr:hypothetical protein [Elusimicrobiota bacterium]
MNKCKLFVASFAILFFTAVFLNAQEYSQQIELKSIGMIAVDESQKNFNIKFDLKNVNNKDLEVSFILFDKDNEELMSWKGFISPSMDEIVIKKSVPADLISKARFIELK